MQTLKQTAPPPAAASRSPRQRSAPGAEVDHRRQARAGVGADHRTHRQHQHLPRPALQGGAELFRPLGIVAVAHDDGLVGQVYRFCLVQNGLIGLGGASGLAPHT